MLRRLLSLLALPLLAACGESMPVEVVETRDSISQPAPSGATLPATLVVDGQPGVLVVGPTQNAPERLRVVLPEPAVASGRIGQEAKELLLDLEPPVAGTLTWRSRSVADFVPEHGFMPGTAYQATLRKVGQRTPDPGVQWGTRFDTPELTVHHLEIVSGDPDNQRLVLDLALSGPVEPSQIARALRVTVDGFPLMPTRVFRPDEPHRIRVLLEGISLDDDRTVRFELGPVPSAVDPYAWTRKRSGQVTYDAGPAVEVHSVALIEGTSGFTIEVICDDEGALARGWHRRWMWLPEHGMSERLSPRCLLTDDALATAVRLEPAVDVAVVPTRGGFRLMGDLPRGPLSLEIAAGARTVDGGLLRKRYTQELQVPARSPQVQFVSQGRYLPRSAWRGLPIRHMNLDEVSLTVRHVPPENLVFWLSADSDAATARTSDVILETTVPVAHVPDTLAQTWIDVGRLLPQVDNGLYELGVSGGGTRTHARILITDLTVVAKRDADKGFTAWVLDSHSHAPVVGAQVDLVVPSGRTVGSCRTTSDGGCSLSADDSGPDRAAPVALMVQARGDLTVVELDAVALSLAEQDVSGEPYGADKPYRISAWSERGVYRPGDVVHLAALVRDQDRVAPDTGMPIVITLTDPRDKEVRRASVQTNPVGLVSLDVPLADFAATGSWSAAFSVGETVVQTLAFAVEEFVPERMAVEATPSAEHVLAGSPVRVQVDARYLFGGSASGSRVEVSCHLQPGVFSPPGGAGYRFGRPIAGRVDLGTVDGVLDEAGQAVLSCPTARPRATADGTAVLVAEVAVFEGGSGRTSRGDTRAWVHPRDFYVGVAASEDTLRAGHSARIDGRIVDWSGALVDTVESVDLTLSRVVTEYGYKLDPSTGRERYTRLQRPLPERRETLAVHDGLFGVDLAPDDDAQGFQLVVRGDGASTLLGLSGTGQRYWWDDESDEVDQTPRPLKPTAVQVSLPPELHVGQRATARFAVPYGGRALISLETDRVVRSEWRDVEAGPQTWDFTLPSFDETAYVSVLVLKDPHLDSRQAFLPDRAFGVARSRVVPERWTASLTLDAPDEVRAHTPLEVTLDLGPQDGPTFATVAAVDEGILALTDFASPDPFGAIFPDRALGIDTWETVGWTLTVPPADGSRRTGGDAEGAMERVQMVKPVALWSGVVEIPHSGRTTVTLDVPQYQGALRVMAVAASAERMAHADTTVLVRDPLVVQTTLPRFLNQGDVVDIPVFLTNLSGEDRSVDLALAVEPLGPSDGLPVAVVGADETELFLADGAGESAVFRIRADGAWGAARFTVTATSGELRSVETLEVPVTTAGVRETELSMVRLDDGLNGLDGLVGDWLPATEQTTFWVTAHPYGRAFSHLKYLVRYPYGCLEQTTSTTRPLLFVSNLLEATEPELMADKDVDAMVRHGIERVLSMQTAGGGFAYWLGEDRPNFWGTAYATHMLLDAKGAGYPVSDAALDGALDYMERELAANEGRNDAAHGHAFKHGEAYVHYALALAGRGHKARILTALEDLPAQHRGPMAERRYLLQAALYLAGDRRYEQVLRDPDAAPLSLDLGRRNDASFYSELRHLGFTLSVYQDLFGAQGADQLARRVGTGLESRTARGYSTQELVWGITGLGKRVAGRRAEALNGTLRVDGQERTPEVDDELALSWTVNRASERDGLTLDVDVDPESDLYLVVRSEGMRAGGGTQVVSEGLRVGRELLNTDGTPLLLEDHTLGELVTVRTTIQNLTGDTVANVALVDRLPAGWELENPRLGRGGEAEWVDEDLLWSADHMNLRDDRVEVFGTLMPSERRQIVFQVRAVSAGTFTLPPVQAEAMYDPDLRARQPGTELTVRAPWGDEVL